MSAPKKPSKYGFTETTIIEEWAKKYPPVMNYMSKLNGRKESSAMSLYHFCNWANIDPVTLLDLKKDRNSLDAEYLLDLLKDAKVVFPESRKWHVAACVRGFFTRNYRHLEPEAGRIEYTPKKHDALPPKEDRLALFKAARNPRDQSLVILGTCSAMALETLSLVCRHHLEKGWEEQEIPRFNLPSEIIKGHGKGKYRGVKQITFITPEAKQILMDYFSWMEKHFDHEWQESDHIFLSIKGNIGEPLTYRQVAKRCTKLEEVAGVHFTFHQGRGVLNTALQNVSCDPNWIQIAMGRKVPGNKDPYTLPTIESLRAKYREALPDLEFLSETENAESKIKIRELEANVKALQTELASESRRLDAWLAEKLKDPKNLRKLLEK